jgi:hypothetical protein
MSVAGKPRVSVALLTVAGAFVEGGQKLGLIMLTRMHRSWSCTLQLRAKSRLAALVAKHTLNASERLSYPCAVGRTIISKAIEPTI